MSENNKPGVLHFDEFSFMDNAFGEVGNMIVSGAPGSGKTSFHLIQAVITRYMTDSAKPDDGAPVA